MDFLERHPSSLIEKIRNQLIFIISETNGISLNDSLELLIRSPILGKDPTLTRFFSDFNELLISFQNDKVDIGTLLAHPVASGFFLFFKNFPLPFKEEHSHLTGSLSADFIYPHIKKILRGPQKKIYEKKIKEVYGGEALPIKSEKDVDDLIRLKEGELFGRYLKILFLPKLILKTRKIHEEAAYHLGKEVYEKYNVGQIRLKFTYSRATGMVDEQIPGDKDVLEEDVILGLYDGFTRLQKEYPFFKFFLSPSFRKEPNFFDKKKFKTKEDHFNHQVQSILQLLKKHPKLIDCLAEVDTVGDEKDLYRKKHFSEIKMGLRELQFRGFAVRSHHGETWKTLRRGVQAVDNALNIWEIDTLEHGLSLGINPNYYFHRIYQRAMVYNLEGNPIPKKGTDYFEILDLPWPDLEVKEKLLKGKRLTNGEREQFLNVKFLAAREIEHYQHDVLNRMMLKNVSLVSLPSSNIKLTGRFSDFKDHPFWWWEQKGLSLGVGTDNYITLNTNFIQEMLILLFSDPDNLKITKLLMITTGETRRSYISHLLWKMRKMARPSV